MVNRVLLLRHGETALNRTGALRGQIEVPLSDNGIREAQQLARRIHGEYRISAICSSPRVRALETADEIAQATGLRVQLDERLNDLDYGSWSGRTWDSLSLQDQAEFQRWERDPEQPLPGAEAPAVAQRRAMSSLHAHAAAHEGCVAIVSHDAVIQLILCEILAIDLRSYRGIVQHTATLNELERTPDGWCVHLLNTSWHLA